MIPCLLFEYREGVVSADLAPPHVHVHGSCVFSESRRSSGCEDCHKNFPLVFLGEGFFELLTKGASFWSDGLDDGFPFSNFLLFLYFEAHGLFRPRQLCNFPALSFAGVAGLVPLWFWFQVRDGGRPGKLQVFP